MEITKLNIKGNQFNFTDEDAQNKIEEIKENVYTKEDINNALSDINESLKDYAKTKDIAENYQPKGDYLTEHQSLENYYTKEDVDNAIDAIPPYDDSVISNRVAQLEAIDHSQYLTEHQDISDLATKAEVKEVADKIDSIEIPTKVSELENDSNYQTQSQVDERFQQLVGAAPEALDTLEEIAAKLSDNDDVHSALVNSIAEKVTKPTNGTSSQFLKADGSVDSTEYLPTTGGTIISENAAPIILNSTNSSSYVALRFQKNNTLLGGIAGRSDNDSLYRIPNNFSSGYKIWDENNDGSESGLDADLLDGIDSKNFLRTGCYSNSTTLRGFLIKTSIAVSNSASTDSMIICNILGNSYNNNTLPINTTIQAYNYHLNSDKLLSCACIHNGYNLGNVKVFIYEGVVCFWIPQTGKYQSISVNVVTPGSTLTNKISEIKSIEMPTEGVTKLTDVVAKVSANIDSNVASADKLTTKQLTNEDLNDIRSINFVSYYASGANTCKNIPSEITNALGFRLIVSGESTSYCNQTLITSNGIIYKRVYNGSLGWSDWKKILTEDEVIPLVKKASYEEKVSIYYAQFNSNNVYLYECKPSEFTEILANYSDYITVIGVVLREGGRVMVIGIDEFELYKHGNLKEDATLVDSTAEALYDWNVSSSNKESDSDTINGCVYNYQKIRGTWNGDYGLKVGQWVVPSAMQILFIMQNIDAINYALSFIPDAILLDITKEYWTRTLGNNYDTNKSIYYFNRTAVQSGNIYPTGAGSVPKCIRPISFFGNTKYN